MRVEIIKKYDGRELKEIMEIMAKKYDKIENLMQRVETNKCRNPREVDDYMVWDSLLNGAEYERKTIISMYEFFKYISPKRMELLSYLIQSGCPQSIRALSEKLRRNYKNVYDDLIALERFGLIRMERVGRRRIPRALADTIVISLK
ncbi:MAG: hypothetical protein DRN20_01690 [Thermoplasmata archaeon]|nr:MAG: hypothetical protein DRN20_01690 [Thermoplasmata archaeon]